MSDQNSQANKEISFSELCERARQRAAEANQQNEEKKGKGLEFMALRLDVARKHIELAVTKKITPAEDNLLKILELGTIGAQNSRSQISTKAEFFLDDLAMTMGILKNKVYVHIKSLEAKGYITREKTRSKGREILGLNPVIFGGQILNDQQSEKEKKRHLRLVDKIPFLVDKSEEEDKPEVQNQDVSSPESGPVECQNRTEEVPNQDQNTSEIPEFTTEKLALDSFRFKLDSLRGQKQETHVSGLKKKRTQEEHEEILRQQIEAAKAGRL